MSRSGTSPTSPATSIPGSSAGASCGGTACSKASGRRSSPTVLPGAWRFAIDVNLATSVQAVWGPIGRLVVGGLLGPAGAALFRVASTLADSAQKPADLLGKAFYPEVMRMDLTTKKPWKLMLRGTALVSAIALLAIVIMLVGGKPLMALLFGKEFLGAYAPLVILMADPVPRHLQLPADADALRARPLRRAAQGQAARQRGVLRHHRALVLDVGRRRRGDRAGPRQCRQHRRDDGAAARRAPPRAARRRPRAPPPRSRAPSPAGRARPASSAGSPSGRAARRWGRPTWRWPDRDAFP